MYRHLENQNEYPYIYIMDLGKEQFRQTLVFHGSNKIIIPANGASYASLSDY